MSPNIPANVLRRFFIVSSSDCVTSTLVPVLPEEVAEEAVVVLAELVAWTLDPLDVPDGRLVVSSDAT